MNILPKKSWHVRTRKNIERVKRDEAEAARVAKLEQDRVLRAEQEARRRELRVRAGLPPVEEGQGKHFNLFEGCSEQQQSNFSHEDDAEEMRTEARRLLRVDTFNKLVRSADVQKPWYCNSKTNKEEHKQPNDTIKSQDSKSQSKLMKIYDPMSAIKRAEMVVDLRRRKAIRDKLEFTAPLNADQDQSKSTGQTLVGLGAGSGERDIHTIHLDGDSSPEIIKEVSHSKGKLKKEKKHHKKHHHHHHHHHKKKKKSKSSSEKHKSHHKRHHHQQHE